MVQGTLLCMMGTTVTGNSFRTYNTTAIDKDCNLARIDLCFILHGEVTVIHLFEVHRISSLQFEQMRKQLKNWFVSSVRSACNLIVLVEREISETPSGISGRYSQFSFANLRHPRSVGS